MHAVFTLLPTQGRCCHRMCTYSDSWVMTQLVHDIGPAPPTQVTTDWTRFQAIQSTWTETQWAQYHAHHRRLFPCTAYLTCWMLRHTPHVPLAEMETGHLDPASTAVADCIEMQYICTVDTVQYAPLGEHIGWVSI